ncbi:MAG TPA: hypothetical protein VLF39_01120 [Candidatus Saccharimonadales bacterium]|nr:hypothetical protein [Candidatus Saccharimonadales bacterium]
MIQIEAGGSVLAETLRQPMDPKILGGLAVGNFIDETVLHTAEKQLENSLQMASRDVTREFGACIAYGVNLSAEAESLLTNKLVASSGALITNLGEHDNSSGIDKLWTISHADRVVDLRRQHMPIVYDNGDIEEDGTIFYLAARKLGT